jgi:hypothetical protein
MIVMGRLKQLRELKSEGTIDYPNNETESNSNKKSKNRQTGLSGRQISTRHS